MTEKFPDIISPEDGEERESTKEALKQWRQEGMELIEGELEKTERENTYIETVNKFINSLFEYLEIDKPEDRSLFSEQFHILDGETYQKKFPDMVGMRGFYRSIDDAIYIDRDCKNPDESLEEISKFETFLHESLHSVSHQKFHANKKLVQDYRVGYRMGDINEKGRNLEGFNEGIVSLIEIDLMRSFVDNLEEQFGFTKEQIEGPIYSYSENQGLVTAIIKRIAEYKDEDPQESFRRIVKGHFTGEMMHLRDIEKNYGEGSLEILARYGNREDESNNDIILEYFETTEEDRREEIKKKVLNS